MVSQLKYLLKVACHLNQNNIIIMVDYDSDNLSIKDGPPLLMGNCNLSPISGSANFL